METCNYCNGKFNANSLNRHQTECKQIYSPTSLTDSQQDVFIRKLLIQVNKMSNKMTELQHEISYLKKKQKTQIVTILNNQSDNIPQIHILQWIKSIPVSQSHLELVFKKSLEDGLKQVLIDGCSVASTVGSKNIPIRAFTEKQKCIFVYLLKEDDTKWVICDNATFRKMCAQIASRFIELFMSWQTETPEVTFNDSQEQNMHFMKKVMDNSYAQQGHISKMIEDVYASIHIEMHITEYA